jgi:hypothetical protein
MGTEALSPGVKQPVCEADHSPPTKAVVKKIWIYSNIPLYAFMVLTFTFILSIVFASTFQHDVFHKFSQIIFDMPY